MKRITTIILFFTVVFSLYGQNSEPTISTVNGKQDVCINRPNFELEVKINVPPGFNKEIEYFEISWYSEVNGEKQDTIISGSLNPDIFKLNFKLGGFYKTCKAETEGTVRLDTYLKGVDKPLNNAFFPLFINPPTAKFDIRSNICLSELILIDGSKSCPTGSITKFSWKIDNIEVSNLSSFSYSFNKSGTYKVKLEVENECGKSDSTRTINVLDNPIAIAEVDSGAVKSGSVYKACLNDKDELFIKLDGSKSLNNKKFEWSIYNNTNGITFSNKKDEAKIKIKITKTGDYIIILKVSDPCDIPDYDTLRFIVNKAEVISLNTVSSSCNPITFTPSPNLSNASYFVNGTKTTSFPITLSYGNHKVIGILNNECGETKDSIEFSVVQATDTKILSPTKDTTVCKSSTSIPIKVNVTNGTFNTNLVQQDNASKEYYFTPSSEGVYTIKYTTGINECKREDEISITVLPSIDINLSSQSDVCIPFQYTPSPYTPNANYTINGQEIKTFPYLVDKQGKYEVKAILKNNCEEVTKSIDFEALDANDLKIIYNGPLSVCVNSDPILLKSSFSNGIFSGNHINVINGETYFTPETTGAHKIKLSLPISNCNTFDEITFEVLGVNSQIKDIDVCEGEKSVELIGTPSGGIWSSSSCNNCISGNIFDLTKTTLEKISIDYTITNDIGCSSKSNAFINVLEPISNFELTSLPCGDNIDFDLSRSKGNQFKWFVNQEDKGNPPFKNLGNGNYTFTLIASIGNCSDTSSKTIFIKTPPANPVDFDLPVSQHCTPYLLKPNIHSDQYDFLNYEWNIIYPDRTEIIKKFDIGEFLLENLSPFNQKIDILFKAENECGIKQNIRSFELLGIPKSIIGIDSSRYGCSPYTIAMSNIAQGEMSECIWRVNGKEIRSCDPYIYQTFVANDTITKFPIELEVSNECGKSISHDTITVSPPWIDVFFNTDEYEVCPNTPVYFEDATTPEPIYWRWSFGDGQFSDEQNPTVVFKTPGLYQVTLKASTGCGYDSITRPVLVKEVPDVDFILPVYTCQNQISDSIINLSDYQNHKFIWDFGDGILDSTNAHPKHTFLEFGVTNVSLTMVDKETHCFASLTKPFEVKAQPQIDIVLDSLICYGKEVQVPNNTLYANDYTWYYDKVPVHSGKDALIIFKETGEHYIQLIATYNDKCVDSISKVVFVRRCDVYIPNVFTPNNDGKDDFFTAYGGVNTSMIRSIKIFDRWGELVFSKNDYPLNVEYLGWDGSVSTRSKSYGVNSAVFIYMIEVEFTDGSTEMFTGDVTLLR